MRRDSRQRAMLLEMGIRLWPAAGDAAEHADAEPGVALASRAPVATATAQAAVAEAGAAQVVSPDHAGRGDRGDRGGQGDGRAAGRPVPPADVRPQPIASAPPNGDALQLDWPELEATVATCTACGLCQGRRQTVFGTGNRGAHWMIVGEAPGAEEDRLGEPFVGKSGKLLDNMLRAVGLGRTDGAPERQVYIANTVKCRPPGNRNPTPAELATCEPFLMRQVQLVQPRIILAMGRFAVDCLLRSNEPIGRLRGRLHHYQGVPLVVTYHPAYLLRNPQDKARAWDDLCLAADTLQAAPATPS